MMSGLLTSFSVAVVLLGGAAGGPQWSSDYGAALREAKRAQRPLLIVLDDPNGSGQRIRQVALADGRPSSLLQSYELCHIDVTTAYGKKVAEAFQATEFPYVAITNKTGSAMIHRQTGPLSTQQWTAMLARYEQGRVVSQPAPADFTAPRASRRPVICFT